MSQLPQKFVKANTAKIDGVSPSNSTNYGENLQVSKFGRKHFWDVEFQLKHNFESEYRELTAFFDELNGRQNTFQMKCPLRWLSGQPTFGVNGVHPKGSTTININLVTTNIATGDFINFSGHNKVYKVTSGRTSNGDIRIFPPLTQEVANGVTISEATFTLRLKSDTSPFNLDGSKLTHAYTIRAKEDV